MALSNSMYQLENLINGLLESLSDKDNNVQETIIASLSELGKKKTTLVLTNVHNFQQKNLPRLTESQRVNILKAIEKIVKENPDRFDEKMAEDLIKIALSEMMQSGKQEVIVPWQTAASNVLVAVGIKHVKLVFNELIKQFNPGVLPNLFILHTMSNLAETNPFGVVPQLSSVLASMLPMLGMAKIDNYKIAFSSALCKFSEAILYYCSNKDKAEDKSIEKNTFSAQIYAAHEILFNMWVKSSDAKLRQVCIEAIGHFIHLIESIKIENDMIKMVPGLLGLYKRHIEHYCISQAVFSLIYVSNQSKSIQIETLLDTLFKELFSQVLNSIDAKDKHPKSQNELLRCFAEMSTRFCDRLLPFLMQKLEQNNAQLRIASLTIMRHLINASNHQMSNKKEIVLSGLRPLLGDSNNKVKRYLIQTIIAMSYHGYLHLEGGNLMIEFIIKQCALPDDTQIDTKKQPIDFIDNGQLRNLAESVLTLFSTTVDGMQNVLWPNLFEYLTNNDYLRGINHLCKCLALIAEQKRDRNELQVNFKEFVNIPKQQEIFARLVVLSGVPQMHKNRGLNALSLMKHISPLIHTSISDLWDKILPKLYLNLEDQLNNSKFEQRKWDDIMVKMISRTLELIADENEACEFGAGLGKHLPILYHTSSEEKHFAYKCLGIVMSKTENKSFIEKHLNIVFNTVNHASQLERDGCAIAFGYCASVHLDSVLTKLENLSKNETKRSGGLFSGFLSSGSGSSGKDSMGQKGDPDQIKTTLVLSYGYVTLYASNELIVSRLEANILKSVLNFAQTAKEFNYKQNVLKSLELITQCMHQDHLQKDFNFSYKSNLLEQIIAYINADSSKVLTHELKSMCFKVASNIVKLNPKPSEADFYQLIKSTTDSFYALPLPVDGLDKKTNEVKLSSNETNPNLLHGNQLFEATSNSLDNLLVDILNRDLNSNGLFNIYKHLEPWIVSVNDHERERAIRSFSISLKHYANSIKVDSTQEVFQHFGPILGRLVCRCTDPVIKIRQYVSMSIGSLLAALDIYSTRNQDKDYVKQLDIINDKLSKNEPNLMLAGVNDLAKILCRKIPSDQLILFIEKLFEGLLDVQSHCSSAACIVLHFCVKTRGNELKDHVDAFIRHLYSKLSQIKNPQAKLGSLRTIRTLFQQHLTEALDVLLTFPIPCSNDTIDICQSLCEEPNLLTEIIENILKMWSRCLPYEEKSENLKYALLTPLIGTAILNEIFSNFKRDSNGSTTSDEKFEFNFEKIFVALIIRLASTVGTQMPILSVSKDEKEAASGKQDAKNAKIAIQNDYKKLEPVRIAYNCLMAFIRACERYDLVEFYEKENLLEKLTEASVNIEAFELIAKGLYTHASSSISELVEFLLQNLSAPYECQKIGVTAVFAEFLNHESIIGLTEILINNLLTRLIDPCVTVRTLCIRGLGNVSSLGANQVQRYSTTTLSAMMAGLDDKDDFNDDITLEGMNGLAKIIALIDENNVRPILINILLRIRPCFEKDKPKIRSSAYILFGKLTRFGHGPSRESFNEQIHSNFVTLILHLNEDDAAVKKSCKFALRQVGPHLGSTAMNELFQKALVDDINLHYGEFINNLSKILISEFSEKVSSYIMNCVSNFKSQWDEIRGNAVLFLGYLLGNLSLEKQSSLSKEHITNGLIKLLKEDPSPMVRCKSADAISLLSEF